jgi:hypothetical protein
VKELVQKFIEIEHNISGKYGTFNLFALFLREDSPDKWDLVIASPWISKDKQSALKCVAEYVRGALDTNELLMLSRIVILDDKNKALDAINKAISTTHGAIEIRDSDIFGLRIKHAYLITSLKNNEN